MKIPMATNRTADFLQEWIQAVAALPERHNLEAWITYAEHTACGAGDDDILIEMRSLATATGSPETVKLSRDLFDWWEVDE